MNRSKYATLLIFLAIINCLKAQDTIKLVCNNFYEWRKITDTDSCTGIDLDIWYEIADRLDLIVELKPCYTLESFFELLKSGEADIAVSLVKNEEREKFIEFIEPPFRTKWYYRTYVKKNDIRKIQHYNDLFV